jgi:hypothetical protein
MVRYTRECVENVFPQVLHMVRYTPAMMFSLSPTISVCIACFDAPMQGRGARAFKSHKYDNMTNTDYLPQRLQLGFVGLCKRMIASGRPIQLGTIVKGMLSKAS